MLTPPSFATRLRWKPLVGMAADGCRELVPGMRLASQPGRRGSNALVVFMVVLLVCAGPCSVQAAVNAVQQESTGEAKTTFEHLLDQGKQLIKQREFAAAVKSLEAALAILPQSPEALYQLGVALISSGRYAEGVRYLEQSVEQSPRNLALRLVLADVYEKGGLADQAANELKRIVDMGPATPQGAEADIRLTLLVSKQLIAEGKPESSLEMLSNQVKRYPGEKRLLNHLGIALMVANKLDEAQEIFAALIEQEPNDAAAHLNLALVYSGRDQMERAVPHLEKVLEIAPETGMAQKAAVRLGMYRGKQALDRGDFATALNEFRDVVAKDPENELALLSVATIHHHNGNVADAEAIYRQIIAALPDHLDARLRLGRLYAETNRVEQAVNEFEAVVSHGGDQPQVAQAQEVLVGLMVSTANGLVTEGKLDEGIALYEKIVSYDADNPEGHRRLGMLLQSRSRPEDARAQFAEMVRLEPLNPEGHMLLAKTLDALNQLDEAQLEYSRALALEQDEAKAKEIATALRIARARELLSGDKVAEGRSEVENLLRGDPENRVALFFLALIQTQQRQLGDALATYRTLLEIQPDHQRARLNLALLLERMNRDEEAIAEYRIIVQPGSANEQLADQARERLAAVQQRLRGADYSMGYSLSRDGNSNLSETAPTQELRTDLNLNFSYHFKTRSNVRYRFAFSPNYAQFHEGHFDFLTLSYSGFATVLNEGRSWGGGYTHQTRLSLLNQQRGSTSDDLSLNGSWSLDKQELRARASLSTQASETPSLFDSTVFGIGGSVDRLLGERSALTFDYDLTSNDSTLDIGRDYAYLEHAGAVTLDYRITSRLSGDLRYSLALRKFTNPDSFTGFTTRRENVTNGLKIGATYRYANDLTFFGNYTYTVNDSNLPVGLIFSSVDLQEVVGPQSSSLGDYNRGLFSVGMSLRF